MIDRIASAPFAATPPGTRSADVSSVRAVGHAVIDALTAVDPIGVPLRAIAEESAATLVAAVGRSDSVGVAQIERAVLSFAREAKAFAIGHADRGATAVRAALADAVAQGAAAADRMTSGTFDAGDHAISTLAHAAVHLQTN